MSATHIGVHVEVMLPESAYYQAVDVAETEQPLDGGHFCEVRMNLDQANPRIGQLLQEVEEDLSPFVNALRTLGEPATITQIQTEIVRSTGAPISRAAVQHRLES
ncbi:MAG: hypothetical protein E6J20_17685 [Chloroflexi bacterium]|nr:MAG: hypothetical protein E6J20_17685 [Chloroflexota bacterium]